jgi:hypothetical protein
MGSVRQTHDGGFIVCASSDSPADGNKTSSSFGGSDAWVLRLDAGGDKLWEQSYGGAGRDGLTTGIELADGSFVLVGDSESEPSGNKTSPRFGVNDGWVLRLAANGVKLGEGSYGGSDADGLFSIVALRQGGYLLGGYSQSPISGNKTSPKVGGNDYWLVRLDANLNKLWDRAIGGGNPYGSALYDLEQTSDGGFILAGESFNDVGGDKTVPSLGGGDGWVLKLSPEFPECDADGDGVPDERDQCADTSPGSLVNAHGCSIAQLCPCDGPWRNHAEYVDCVVHHAWQFFRDGLITADQRRAIVRDAAQSDCGRHPPAAEPMHIHLLPITPEEFHRDGLQFVVSGDAAGNCVVETSTDLMHWTPLQTLNAVDMGNEAACPPPSSERSRFFRVRTELP